MRKLFFISLALFILFSCEDDKTEIIIEDLLTVNTGYINYDDEAKTFLVITNNSSDIKYIELQNDSTYVIKSDGDFRKDKIHIHICDYNKFNFQWEVTSYFDITKGKTLNLGTSDSKKTTNSHNVYVSFSNIPEYDLVTLSAMYRGHCHTQTGFALSCSPNGLYQTFDEDFRYYVCLQDATEGKYKLEEIPLDASNYTISLDNLSNDMTKHTFPKLIIDKEVAQINIKGFDSDKMFEIFNPKDPVLSITELFDNEIVAYVPNSVFQSFSTSMRYEKGDYYFINTIEGDVTSEFTFMDNELEVININNSIPEINFEGSCNTIKLSFGNDDVRWKIYIDSHKDIKYPDFPEEMLESGILNALKNNIKYLGVELTSYPNSDVTYQDIIDAMMTGTDNLDYGDLTIVQGYSAINAK